QYRSTRSGDQQLAPATGAGAASQRLLRHQPLFDLQPVAALCPATGHLHLAHFQRPSVDGATKYPLDTSVSTTLSPTAYIRPKPAEYHLPGRKSTRRHR